MELGIVDISSAFTQSHPVHPTQRVVLILPPYLPCPWSGSLNLPPGKCKNNFSGATHGMVTIKPIYGTTCAPLRWFARLSEAFRIREWQQSETDPCLFRLTPNDLLLGLAAVHVDDVLVAMQTSAWHRFQAVIDQFAHSGIVYLKPGVSATYLGLDLQTDSDNSIRMSQVSFASERLQLLEESDYITTSKELVPLPKRTSLGRQIIGSLIWMLQTRVGLSHRICLLSTSMRSSVEEGDKSFTNWVKSANKLIHFIRDHPLFVTYRSCFNWVPLSCMEVCLKLKIDGLFGCLSLFTPLLIIDGISFRGSVVFEGPGWCDFAHGIFYRGLFAKIASYLSPQLGFRSSKSTTHL